MVGGDGVSVVSNVMLSVTGYDIPTADQFVAWIGTECPRGHAPEVRGGVGTLAHITGPDNRWGGDKFPECDVYAGALNHADLGALLERFGSTPWRVPAAVQLLVMDQEQMFFRLWMIRDGRVH